MWFIGYAMAMLVSVGLWNYYAERHIHWGIAAIVAVSWALGFSYFLVLPFDIAGAFCRSCDPAAEAAASALTDLDPQVTMALNGSGHQKRSCDCFPSAGLELLDDIIPVCYGLTMLNGYVMNDLLRSYIDSGEFTRRGKLKDAAKDAAIFYVPALAIILVFVGYMIVHDGMTFELLRALGRGFINAIGLFLLVAFLGYGFVEVPRDLFNKANTEGQLRYFKFRVAVQSEALQNARRKLEETLELVHSTDAQLRHQPHTALHEHMATILRQCPRSTSTGGTAHNTQPMQAAAAPPSPDSVENGNGGSSSRAHARDRSGNGGMGATDERLLPSTRKGLVALNLRLKRALANEKRQRSMYELSVQEALSHQALFRPEPEANRLPEGTRNAERSGIATLSQLSFTPTLLPENRRWHGEIKPWLYKIGAGTCACLSAIIIWCEVTILFDDPPFNLNLSPLSYFFRFLGRGGGGFISILLLYVPLLYCAFCAYFAMFQMKLCDSVALHPHKHSDGSSLLFNATYACRLGPPLCFNFLKMLHEKDPRGLFVHRMRGASASTTYFTMSTFGAMDQIPFFSGDYFNNYAPLLIVVIAGCTLLNLGSGLLSCCAKCCPCVAAPAFSFDEDFSDARIDHGAQILLHEKQAMVEGVPLGANLQLLSGATSDGEEQTRLRGGARPTPRKFGRLNDDGL